jgi:hypothetical protein
MAIAKLPPDFQLPEPFICVLCGVKLSLAKATAGLLNAHGSQAFACVSHFSELALLIRGWAFFMANERIAYLQQGEESTNLIYGA